MSWKAAGWKIRKKFSLPSTGLPDLTAENTDMAMNRDLPAAGHPDVRITNVPVPRQKADEMCEMHEAAAMIRQ